MDINLYKIEEDKEMNGQLIAFRKILERTENENKNLTELIARNKGCEAASNSIAESIGGIIGTLKSLVDKEEMDVLEFKNIRQYIQRAQMIALSRSEDARLEIAKLQGEGRRIVKQLQEIKALYKNVIAEHQRKLRVEEEDEEYRKEKNIDLSTVKSKKKRKSTIKKESTIEEESTIKEE